jgi:hypothetical protein
MKHWEKNKAPIYSIASYRFPLILAHFLIECEWKHQQSSLQKKIMTSLYLVELTSQIPVFTKKKKKKKKKKLKKRSLL